jgi:hypothetical protein
VRSALSLLTLLLLAACGPRTASDAPKPLATVDVTDKPDAAASLATDAVAKPHADDTGIAGALPAGFPRDVPLPEPSSLVDFDSRSVTLEVQAPLAQARSSYERRLRAAGFAPAGESLWQSAARAVAVGCTARGGATRIRIEIR